ncbi:hypothetical protein [Agreia sp. VKM Ac-1783]|uniref:hypothetical protein n=1 Tax=Agreia sp. VKM Ac-1783 TaxID=1938889 RepID=UPI000A3730A8|nr:hypothetical protein [Agreia sp. VKM Ac-1783]
MKRSEQDANPAEVGRRTYSRSRAWSVTAALAVLVTLSACSGPAGTTDNEASGTSEGTQTATDTGESESSVTANTDISAVTTEQADTCAAFGISERVQELLGDSALTTVDDVDFGVLSQSGSACVYTNASGDAVQLFRYTFKTADTAGSQLGAIPIQLKDYSKIHVDGSPKAFVGMVGDMAAAYAQFDEAVIQINDMHEAGGGDADTATTLLQAVTP